MGACGAPKNFLKTSKNFLKIDPTTRQEKNYKRRAFRSKNPPHTKESSQRSNILSNCYPIPKGIETVFYNVEKYSTGFN